MAEQVQPKPQAPAPTPPPAKSAPPDEGGRLVTYVPGRDDPAETKWRGVTFRANVAVRIKDPDHIEAAKGNRFYKVEGEAQARNPTQTPTTNQEYRAHVVGWSKAVRTCAELIETWAADRRLRQDCEVGLDDVEWLGTIIEPRLRQMRLEEGLTELDVANLWVKHGVLELPWRS